MNLQRVSSGLRRSRGDRSKASTATEASPDPSTINQQTNVIASNIDFCSTAAGHMG